ncbi:MAG: AAA family ATPase, partial [Bacteroidota bacterium]
MKKKFLPIGIQYFGHIYEGNYVYVDKTEQIFRLAEGIGALYFLSRPRRFGKSLLVSTLKELFSGSKDLFQGLWIEDKWDWSKTNPVIHLSFDAINYREVGLEAALQSRIEAIAQDHGIELVEHYDTSKFGQLIKKLSEKEGNVVILVDEYDKPIIDYLEKDQYPKAKENQKIMKSFYSVLKPLSNHIRLLFITGVSKFSKVSIFSDLNHLDDLTLQKDYATLTGYTQQELELYFGDYLKEAENYLGIDRTKLLDQLRLWYNGYSWNGKDRVYNPFGVLRFLSNLRFDNYWFATGTPSFLLEQMKRHSNFAVENTEIRNRKLEKYTIENIDLVPLLFQTGYLTIKSINPLEAKMVLDYPNLEVRESMYHFIIDGMTSNTSVLGTSQDTVETLTDAFLDADLDEIKAGLNTLLASLPSEVFDKKSEGLYHGLIHLTFQLLGLHIKSESHSAKGRADALVETSD